MTLMRFRLFLKRLFFPGFDVSTRKRKAFVHYFKKGNIETLDAGCGNGAFSLAAWQLGNRVLGIDFDKEKLERCVTFRDYRHIPADKCEFKVWNIYEIEKLGKTFDQIICFETLEHLKDDVQVIASFSRILREGGLLHISTPTRLRKPYYGEIISEKEDGGHVRLGYTHEDFEKLLTPHSFRIIHRGDAVGFFGQLLLNTANWIDLHALHSTGNETKDAVHLLLFCVLYPFTFLDPLISSPRLNTYVAAEKYTHP